MRCTTNRYLDIQFNRYYSRYAIVDVTCQIHHVLFLFPALAIISCNGPIELISSKVPGGYDNFNHTVAIASLHMYTRLSEVVTKSYLIFTSVICNDLC